MRDGMSILHHRNLSDTHFSLAILHIHIHRSLDCLLVLLLLLLFLLACLLAHLCFPVYIAHMLYIWIDMFCLLRGSIVSLACFIFVAFLSSFCSSALILLCYSSSSCACLLLSLMIEIGQPGPADSTSYMHCNIIVMIQLFILHCCYFYIAIVILLYFHSLSFFVFHTYHHSSPASVNLTTFLFTC